MTRRCADWGRAGVRWLGNGAAGRHAAEKASDLGERLVGGDEDRLRAAAMLGLRDPHGAWSDLRERLGRPVFEIPTLPPSVPGMRMFEALRAALRAAGARLVMGARVVGPNGTPPA